MTQREQLVAALDVADTKANMIAAEGPDVAYREKFYAAVAEADKARHALRSFDVEARFAAAKSVFGIVCRAAATEAGAGAASLETAEVAAARVALDTARKELEEFRATPLIVPCFRAADVAQA